MILSISVRGGILGGDLYESPDVLLSCVTLDKLVSSVVGDKSLHVTFVAIGFFELLLCIFVDVPLQIRSEKVLCFMK